MITRFFAALLIVGGILGIGLTLVLGASVGTSKAFALAPLAVLFAFGAHAGWRLWRSPETGWRRATLLYALQIPIVHMSGLVYTFYMGVAINLMGGATDSPFSLECGANAYFFLGAEVEAASAGVNLFALLATAWLYLHRPQARSVPAGALRQG